MGTVLPSEDVGYAGRRVSQGLLVVLAATFFVLVTTGVYLFFRYAPSDDDSSPIRNVHRIATVLFVLATVAVLVTTLLRRQRGALATALVVATAVALTATGNLLPWDQLGVREITVGRDYRGYRRFLFGNEIRFAIIDGAEVSPASVRTVLVLHGAVLPLVAVGMMVARRRARWRLPSAAPTPGAGTPSASPPPVLRADLAPPHRPTEPPM